MQIYYKAHLSISAYIKQSGWWNARLKACLVDPSGHHQLHRHGIYARKYSDGMRIARYYCRTCWKTFSLLPHGLGSPNPASSPDRWQGLERTTPAPSQHKWLVTPPTRNHPSWHGMAGTNRHCRWNLSHSIVRTFPRCGCDFSVG